MNLFFSSVVVCLYHFILLVRAGCKDSGLCCPGRNSDCVVQNYPLNFIPDIPDDEKCYCDEHCLKLGDCCADYKSTCAAEECEVSEFSGWSKCSSNCGVGVKTRSRHVIKKSSNGGVKCPNLMEKRGCMGFQCTKDERAAIKEVGLLLPAKYGAARTYKPEDDINHNLKKHYYKHLYNRKHKRYCLKFEVTRSHKCSASFDLWTKNLTKPGTEVCVECQPYAMSMDNGSRCKGQGIAGVETRWKATNVPGCSGRWIQQELIQDCTCSDFSLPSFILV